MTFHLTHADAVTLVDQLSSAIQEDDENSKQVLPAYPAQGMGVRGHQGQGEARGVERSDVALPCPPSYNTTVPRADRTGERAPVQVPVDFKVNEGDRVIPFTISDQFRCPTPVHYIQVHMTNNPYVVARLTMNGPDYQGKLHATPYGGTEPIDTLTNEAMRMLELEFPVANFVNEASLRIGDQKLQAKVIMYQVQLAEVEHIKRTRAALEHRCYQVGLEMGLSQH